MSHEDSPTGQQFHVRYDYTYANGTTHTLWGLIHTSREEAEVAKRRYVKDGCAAEIFVREVSPWRQDVPGNCRCGCPESEHRSVVETGGACDRHECWGFVQ